MIPRTAHPPRRFGWLPMATFLVLGGLLPSVLMASYPPTGDLSSLLLRMLLLEYAAVHLAFAVARRTMAPTSALFWFFAYVSMGLVPVAQLVTQRTSELARTVTTETLGLASAVVLIGFVAYDLGYVIARRGREKPAGGRRQRERAPVPARRVSLPWLRIISVAGLLLSLRFIATAGLATLFTNRQDAGDALSEGLDTAQSGEAGRAFLETFGTVPVLLCFLLYLAVIRFRLVRLGVADWIITLMLAFTNVAVNNPISNSRYWSLSVLMGVVLVLIGPSARAFGWILAPGVLAAIVLFPVADITRSANTNGTAASSFNATDIWQLISQKDYDQFTMVANTIAFTDDRGFQLGNQALGVLLFWVPRAQWPTKPFDTGVEIGKWMQAANVNLSSPLWSESWIDFGVIGVVVVFLAGGILCHRVDTFYAATSFRSSPAVAVSVAVLAGYEFILLRGPLLQASGRFAIILLVMLTLSVLATPRRQIRLRATLRAMQI